MVKKAIVFILPIFLYLILPTPIFAQFDCLNLTTLSPQGDKDFCRNELTQIEAELQALVEKQEEQKKQTGTLKGDVEYLTSQINALKTKIKARALAISQLKVSIKEKTTKITTLSGKIEQQHESIAQLIRNTNSIDNENLIYVVFSNDSVSSFYNDLESYMSIKEAVKASVDALRGIKTETETEKKDLEKKQDAETYAKAELENAQRQVAQSEAEKKKLLTISQYKEAEYQKLAAEKKTRADKIKAALFELRDAEAIPFGTALAYAEAAEEKTGVRAAFILAILKQETNLGANVGSCLITNLFTGETKSVKSGTIFSRGIHPTRDLPPLQSILDELGRNPFNTRVSCPLAVGYGGAMGPAQFIPSTWNLIKSKVATVLNKSLPDPWNPADAIMASALLLRDGGAGARTFTAERNAACRYYSGRSCTDLSVRNLFYGNAVMALTKSIQADIDLLYN